MSIFKSPAIGDAYKHAIFIGGSNANLAIAAAFLGFIAGIVATDGWLL